MAGIFISYRRDDTGGDAGRLYDRLRDRFGGSRVFRDVDTIEPGGRFPLEIEAKLARCDVLIALIGRQWLTSVDARGEARLQDRDDYVRLEIATALRRGIPVIPALLDKAAMPTAAELPPDLAALAQCQAIEIDETDFHDDVDRLIAVLEPKVRRDGFAWLRSGRRRAALWSAASLVAVAVGAVVVIRGMGGDTISLRSDSAVLTPDQVRASIIEHGFFSATSNPAGNGIPHEYRQELANGAPLVIDEATALTWEQAGSDRIVQGGRNGAAEYVHDLNRRRVAGFGDWRLPTLEEAMSIMSRERQDDAYLDAVFAPAAAPFIWTADYVDTERGWVVYYYDGFTSSESLDFNGYVRAVRSH